MLAVLLLVSACGGARQRARLASNNSPRTADATAISVRRPAYALTKGTVRLLGALKRPLQIDVYATRSVSQITDFVEALTVLLTEYERASTGKFTFRLIDVNTEQLRQRAKEAQLQEQSFGEEARAVKGYLGMVFTHGSEVAVIPNLPPTDGGVEFWVSNKIREIQLKADNLKVRIGVISNKAELKLSDTNLVPRYGDGTKAPSVLSVIRQAFPFYALEEVDLKDGAADIEKGLAGLIVTQPGVDYSERELRRIDDFLMLGGKALTVYASAVGFKPYDASMIATLNTQPPAIVVGVRHSPE
jgi:ABC-type uncharacterized transport system involved in gliding motility auxiliary subunit